MSSNIDNLTEDTSYNEKEKSETKNLMTNPKKKYTIDKIRHRYPYCIVWTPIPILTWIFPAFGHVGICESNGVIHDFAGSYHVSEDNMSFGFPTKTVLLKLSEKEFNEYDKAISEVTNQYNKMGYNWSNNNCHSFVAKVLNKFKYRGKSDYNVNNVLWIVMTEGKFLSWTDMFKSYSGFMIIMIIILTIYYLIKSIYNK